VAQDGVAGGVAEGVVDLLEAVEVEMHHADGVVLTGAFAQQAGQLLLQPGAVGEAGERVVMGVVGELGAAALRLLPGPWRAGRCAVPDRRGCG
jgi:hypothetical protein